MFSCLHRDLCWCEQSTYTKMSGSGLHKKLEYVMHFSTVLSCKIHFTLRNCEQFIATTLSTGNFYMGGAMGFDRHQDLLGHRLPLHKPLLNHSFLVNVSCMTFMKNLQNKLYKLNVFKKYCNLCVYGCTLTFFSHSTITNLVNTF